MAPVTFVCQVLYNVGLSVEILSIDLIGRIFPKNRSIFKFKVYVIKFISMYNHGESTNAVNAYLLVHAIKVGIPVLVRALEPGYRLNSHSTLSTCIKR